MRRVTVLLDTLDPLLSCDPCSQDTDLPHISLAKFYHI